MRDFGPRNGETRTRTGDTTIFSRARRSGLRARFPGSYVVSAGVRPTQDVRSLRIFITVCGNGRRLRPRFGTRAVSAASGSEHARGFAARGLRRRSASGADHVGRQRPLLCEGGYERGVGADDRLPNRRDLPDGEDARLSKAAGISPRVVHRLLLVFVRGSSEPRVEQRAGDCQFHRQAAVSTRAPVRRPERAPAARPR